MNTIKWQIKPHFFCENIYQQTTPSSKVNNTQNALPFYQRSTTTFDYYYYQSTQFEIIIMTRE